MYIKGKSIDGYLVPGKRFSSWGAYIECVGRRMVIEIFDSTNFWFGVTAALAFERLIRDAFRARFGLKSSADESDPTE